MASASLPGPKWAAVGEDDRGRAFLLVQEISGAVDLRRELGDPTLTETDRRQLSETLGRLVALFHATGFTTPELTAKHILFARETNELTLIDWQTACRVPNISLGDRLRPLAALHASTADHLATPRERLRVLRTTSSRPIGGNAQRSSQPRTPDRPRRRTSCKSALDTRSAQRKTEPAASRLARG